MQQTEHPAHDAYRQWVDTLGVGTAVKPQEAFGAGWSAAQTEIERLNRLVDTLSRALQRYQDEEIEVGGDDPADHPYQRRGSWSADDWCAVEGCTSKASAHP